jgi:hypothetical protein
VTAPLATDIDEVIGRLDAAREAGDVDAAIDAMLDIVSISAGMPGISQQLREITGAHRA